MKLIRLAAVMAASICMGITAYANSAPIQYDIGGTGYSVMPRAGSPLEVEYEELTFDIPVLEVEDTDYDLDGALEHSGTVTAAYHFVNPTDEAVTTQLAFAQSKEQKNTAHRVTLDNEVLASTVRYTYSDADTFYGPDDVASLRESYVEDPFFDPQLPVHCYTFRLENLTEDWQDAVLDYTFADDETAKLLIPCKADSNGVYRKHVRKEAEISLALIGSDANAQFTWTAVAADGLHKTFEPVEEVQMTFADFVMSADWGRTDLSVIDAYNAAVAGLNSDSIYNRIETGFPAEPYELMVWYTYEFTLEPGAAAVNTVSAVLAPTFIGYKNPFYEYSYLLSPAKCWKKFGSLDIRINTPHLMAQQEESSFTQTENGFEKHLDGLPDGELTFSLYRDKKAGGSSSGSSANGSDADGGGLRAVLLALGVFALIGLVVIGSILGLVVLIIVMLGKRSTKKREAKKAAAAKTAEEAKKAAAAQNADIAKKAAEGEDHESNCTDR